MILLLFHALLEEFKNILSENYISEAHHFYFFSERFYLDGIDFTDFQCNFMPPALLWVVLKELSFCFFRFHNTTKSTDNLSFWGVVQKLSMKEDIQSIYR